MPESDLVAALRRRIETEDELLNTRTTIFLATNGLWAASVGVSTAQTLQAGIAVLGIVVTLLWLISSRQSHLVIRALTVRYLKEIETTRHPNYAVEELVQGELSKWRRFVRPTDIMARWLPVTFLLIWVLLLILLAAGSL